MTSCGVRSGSGTRRSPITVVVSFDDIVVPFVRSFSPGLVAVG
jgi:hypothetical protein